jgi:hypothetical protein
MHLQIRVHEDVVHARVETKMHFLIFMKMRKSCENGTIFAKFHFAKIFAKISRKCRENFCENEKSIKFDSDMACMVHVVYFFAITSHLRRIKRHM